MKNCENILIIVSYNEVAAHRVDDQSLISDIPFTTLFSGTHPTAVGMKDVVLRDKSDQSVKLATCHHLMQRSWTVLYFHVSCFFHDVLERHRRNFRHFTFPVFLCFNGKTVIVCQARSILSYLHEPLSAEIMAHAWSS